MRNFLTAIFAPEVRTSKIDSEPPGMSDINIGSSLNAHGNTFYGFPAPVNDDWVATKGYVDTKVATGGSANPPIGSIMMWPTGTPPLGWYLCDGTVRTNATAPDLAAVLGTTFGGVAGTSFAVPDLIRRVAVGAGGGITVGRNDGEANPAARTFAHNHTATNVNHTGTTNTSTGGTGTRVNTIAGNNDGQHTHGIGTQPFDVVPNLCLNFIIRYV